MLNVVVVADQEPVLLAVAVAIAVVLVPSYNFIVEEASAVPENVGVLSDVVVPLDGFDMLGAAGATVSIVMLWLEDLGEVFPALSVAFAVMLCAPLLSVDVVADHVPLLEAVVVAIAVVLLPSYSFTVEEASAVPENVGVASLVTVPLAGEDITGAAGGVASVNTTVTVNDAVPVLPAASVAEQLTVVVPSGNVEPEAGVQTAATEPSMLSVAVTVNDTVLPDAEVASVVMADGTVRTGGVVSEPPPLLDTVTVMLRVPMLPVGSYPLAIRVWEPLGTEAVFHEIL